MRILHTEASCGWGGQEIRILEESSGLIARGHTVAVACSEQSRLHEEAARFGVPVITLPIERKTLTAFLALRRCLVRHPVDVVNTHSSTDSWLSALVCATLPKPPAMVRTRHVSVPVGAGAANRWLYGRASQHIVTTGKLLRQYLIDTLQLPPAKLTSVPTGIDPRRFMPGDVQAARLALGLEPGGHYIGIVATLRSWKGHSFLLEAFAQLAQLAHPNLRLLIVGEGPQLVPIQEKIAALGIGGSVILAGQQTNPERWMQAIDIFCLPSYANEGVPQALLQAMLCGLPIVTTPVGAILEAVTNEVSALIVPPKDALALSTAIQRLLSDPALARRLGHAARETAEAHFSRDAMLDAMETIFRQFDLSATR